MKRPDSAEDILQRIVISLDGPAGSGKTTTAREIAAALDLLHIDTGAMYRAVTWKALNDGVDPEDEPSVTSIATAIQLDFPDGDDGNKRVIADGNDITGAIRTLEVTKNVSVVSSYAGVRRAMVGLQRRLSETGGVVLEGRDIGSVVLPSAHVKVYLDASTDERAERRRKELAQKGIEEPFDAIRADIERRDHFDSNREHSPLKIPVGAHIVDTTSLSISEQVGRVVDIAKSTAAALFELAAKPGQRAELTRKAFHYELIRRFALVCAKLLFGLRIQKKDEIPYVENFIYASNHKSNADPPVIAGTVTRELAFVAKRKLFKLPLLGALIRSLNAFPTRRDMFDRGAMEHCLSELNRGLSLLIFPEGHRIRGEDLGPGKPGIGYIALNSGVAVVPVFLSGTGNLKSAFLRRPRITVIHGRPIRLADPSKIDPTSENCREFTNMVMCAIDGLREEYERGR